LPSASLLHFQKKSRDRLIRLVVAHPTWALGFGDEVWWSRLAQPDQHRWEEDTVTHLLELERSKQDPDPKVLACYGLPLGEAASAIPVMSPNPTSVVNTAIAMTNAVIAWARFRLRKLFITFSPQYCSSSGHYSL
jgi:hypothetical protein